MTKPLVIVASVFLALGALVAGFFMFIVMGINSIDSTNAHLSAQCQTSVNAAPAAVTVKASSLLPGQRHYAEIIIGVAENRGLDVKAAEIGVATAIVETNLSNPLTATNLDSVGLFQQRPSQGWGPPSELTNPVIATNKFFTA